MPKFTMNEDSPTRVRKMANEKYEPNELGNLKPLRQNDVVFNKINLKENQEFSQKPPSSKLLNAKIEKYKKLRPQPQPQTQYKVKFQFDNKYIVYDILLGEGSYSKVYLGLRKITNQKVAIKEVDYLEENEIACLLNSKSPYIIKLFDFWTQNKQSYIALELCQRNLKQEIALCSFQESIEYYGQLIEGMDHLNSKSILHRDLKFQNILIKQRKVKISDFGFAKPIGSKLAVFSERCGTPYTMAPEIYFHNEKGKPVYTQKCDIYSMGVILHQILYKDHPFNMCSNRMKQNRRIKVEKKHGYLDILVDRCLEYEVAKRCNWNQFLKIFTLYKMKKSSEEKENLLFQRKVVFEQPVQDKKVANHHHVRQQKNILRPEPNWRQKFINPYETPKKTNNNNNKQNKNIFEKENPFDEIQIPENNEELHKLTKQPKAKFPYLDNPNQQPHHIEDAWKFEHDQLDYKKPSQSNIQEQDIVSLTKLITIIMAFVLIMLLINQQTTN